MKKRILSIILAITLVFSLSACENLSKGNGNATQSESELDDNKTSQSNDGTQNDSESDGNDVTEGDGTETGNTQKDDTQVANTENGSDDGENSAGDNKNDSNKNDSNKDDSGNKKPSNNQSNGNQNNNNPTSNGSGNNNSNTGSNGGSHNNSDTDTGGGSNNGGSTGNGSTGNSGSAVTTTYVDAFTAEENKLADKVVAQIINSSMGEFDKVKAIHDYLLMNVTYDYENFQKHMNGRGEIPEVSHTARGALGKKKAVCDGYSYAFQLLCLKVGVSCEVVTGESKDINTGKSISHAWNQVKIEGSWYNIDVTWDDPATVNGTVLAPNDHKGCSYEYFCIPDSILYNDHKADDAKYTCTAGPLFERALKTGVPWDNATFVASEAELIALFKTEAQKNNATPSFYIKASIMGGDPKTFISKCMSKAGIDFSSGYQYEYVTYYEGTSNPGTYYKYTVTIVTNGTVTVYPVVSTMAELKAELLKARQAGQSTCLIYYYTNLIAWDNYDTNCKNIIYAECGCYTGITTYWPNDSTEIPQLTKFKFY